MEMTLDEIAARLGVSRSVARKRLLRAGITGWRPKECRPYRKIYKVGESFFLPQMDPVDENHARGLVTAVDIAKRNNCSASSVLFKLRENGIRPDCVVKCGIYMWRDRPEIDQIASLIERKTDKPSEEGQEEKVEEIKAGYKSIIRGSILDDLKEEKIKRQWIGRMGRLVVKGHVVAEGIIESVSMCGVYLKGSTLRGTLKELELTDES